MSCWFPLSLFVCYSPWFLIIPFIVNIFKFAVQNRYYIVTWNQTQSNKLNKINNILNEIMLDDKRKCILQIQEGIIVNVS